MLLRREITLLVYEVIYLNLDRSESLYDESTHFRLCANFIINIKATINFVDNMTMMFIL